MRAEGAEVWDGGVERKDSYGQIGRMDCAWKFNGFLCDAWADTTDFLFFCFLQMAIGGDSFRRMPVFAMIAKYYMLIINVVFLVRSRVENASACC